MNQPQFTEPWILSQLYGVVAVMEEVLPLCAFVQ
jgi:hypothetical protein